MGFATPGPPRSRHVNLSLPGQPFGILSHEIVTLPEAWDSAPCLTAFVASSCRTKANDCAAFGLSRASDPSTRMLPSLDWKGFSDSRAKPRKSAPFQLLRRRRSCAVAIDWIRPCKAPTNEPTEIACLLERLAIAMTLARMFFTRWSSSARSKP